MFGWVNKLARGLAAQPSDDSMLTHFLLRLKDDFLIARISMGDEPKNKVVVDRIESLFPAEGGLCDWSRAYEIERLLFCLRSPSQLAFDCDRKVSEVERRGLPAGQKLRDRLKAANATLENAKQASLKLADELARTPPATPNLEQLRASAVAASEQLVRIEKEISDERRLIATAAMNDLQWFFQKRIAVRKALLDSAKNIIVFGSAIMFIVASPFLMFVFERISGITWFSRLIPHFPNYGLYTAMSFGLLGAFFSRLTSLRFDAGLSVENTRNLFSFQSLLIRITIGMCGAIVVYYLLQTELLGSLLRPNFENLSFREVHFRAILRGHAESAVLIPSADWCMLVVWSFLAGFSEKLVPNTLANAEKQLEGTEDK